MVLRRAAILFVHPSTNGACTPLINDYKFTAAVGTSIEDACFVLHMINKQIPYRYPNIKFIVPHLGGPIPMLLNRLDQRGLSAHLEQPRGRPADAHRRQAGEHDVILWRHALSQPPRRLAGRLKGRRVLRSGSTPARRAAAGCDPRAWQGDRPRPPYAWLRPSVRAPEPG